MKGIYQIQIKNTFVPIEVTSFTPAYKCHNEYPEYQYPDEPVEFEWKAVTENDLLNELIEDFLFHYVDTELYNILDKRYGK